jgi:hypothetical protein
MCTVHFTFAYAITHVIPQEVGGILIREDGLMVMAGAEFMEW